MIFRYLSEGMRMFLRKLRVNHTGVRQYKGNDERVCSQIISDCYNQDKNYFMASNGHFSEFYARDFGWCTYALLRLGYKKWVVNTLDYALNIFKRHGRIEQAISPGGKAFTFPDKYSPDALAFIIRSLRLANARELIKKYRGFLNQEIKRYYDVVIDQSTGLVRKDKSFSSIKDYAVRKSSCYDNVITGMLANDLKAIKMLANPFKKYNYKKLIINNFWTGSYFLDDLSGSKRITGDANVVLFWSGLITDKAMLRKAVNSIIRQKLDKPFPLKYTSQRFKEQKMIFLEFLAGDYERDTIWPHLGLMYIEIVGMINKKLARQYIKQYKQQVDKHKNFLELYDKNGRPFKTLVYYADEAMLWAANYLYLKKLMH